MLKENRGKKSKRRRIRIVRWSILLIIFLAVVFYKWDFIQYGIARTGIFKSSDSGGKIISGTDIILVNRENKLNSNYVPSDLVEVDIDFAQSMDEEHYMRKDAAAALKKLVNGARKDGITLLGLSGYRSYSTQYSLYDYNVQTQGKEYANLYVAEAGASEHQTGCAMDMAVSYSSELTGNSPEGIWLSDNAYRYGFILRYPEGKENITGYNYEPWHIRYVGKKAAKEIHDEGITLEEYADR